MSTTAHEPMKNLDLEGGGSGRAADGEGGSSTDTQHSAKRNAFPRMTRLAGVVLLEAMAILGLLATLSRTRARCATAVAADLAG